MSPLDRVLVFGGTHGNEWTGVYAVNRYAALLQREFAGLDLGFHFSNPEAHRLNKRFKDEDLNRAFQFLHEDRPLSFEHQRAREIKQLIDEKQTFVIDLHTTTANMGTTVILTSYHPLNLWVAGEISRGLPECKIIGSLDTQKKYLASQSQFGMMIEVGPVANGVLNAKALESTIAVLRGIFSALSRQHEMTSGQVEVYQEINDIYYPKNEKGELEAYIHSAFQDRDFCVVSGAYTPFKKFSGEDITLHTLEDLFPVFINEAAYYPQQLAYSLCRKVTKTF
ncbi:MAG TPA: aspartoacylase [Bacteriovoracaceae bacterium]|nr:aspartoacylase [Bacteriovoracaceae bacterium]